MIYRGLGAEFDWGGLISSGIKAASDIVGDVTDVKQAGIERDTATILASAREGSPSGSAASSGGMNQTLVIGGIAAVVILGGVLLLARK
jgi:hypothetical protein